MIELTDTNSSAIAAEFVQARIRAGSPAMGMVMTLIIVAPEDDAAEAMLAAKRASREHPSRVLGVILGDVVLGRDDDQRHHHAHGRAASPGAGLDELRGDLGRVGVDELDHGQGLRQVRPSRASIFSADAGPQVPDS